MYLAPPSRQRPQVMCCKVGHVINEVACDEATLECPHPVGSEHQTKQKTEQKIECDTDSWRHDEPILVLGPLVMHPMNPDLLTWSD